MQIIPLQAIPNQEFTVVLDNNQWNITLKTVINITAASLSLNGVTLLDNTRCVANGLIIPYQYLEAGNFLFLTQNFQLPDYTQFGITQFLVYLSATDLIALRATPTLPLTTADFDPIAALPLRFSPQGYIAAPVPSEVAWQDATRAALGNTASWTDFSLFGNNAVQAILLNQPINTANGMYSNNALIFNATNQTTLKMAAATSINNIFDGGGTVFMVMGNLTVASRLWDKTTSSSTGHLVTASALSGGKFTLDFEQGTSGTTAKFATAASVVPSSPSIINLSYDSTSLNTPPILRVNGVNVNMSLTQSGTGTASSDAASDWYYLNRSNLTAATSANVSEVIIYSSALSLTDKQTDELYLSQKYNIGI